MVQIWGSSQQKQDIVVKLSQSKYCNFFSALWKQEIAKLMERHCSDIGLTSVRNLTDIGQTLGRYWADIGQTLGQWADIGTFGRQVNMKILSKIRKFLAHLRIR